MNKIDFYQQKEILFTKVILSGGVMKLKFFGILFLMLMGTEAMADRPYKNCGNGKAEVKAAREWLELNINEILDTPTISGLRRGEKRRLKRKLKNGLLICKGPGTKACSKDRIGVMRHPFRRKAIICYDAIRRYYSQAFCALAGTILHETAHMAGVRKGRTHNKPNGTRTDLVYKTGYAAESLCASQGLDRAIVERK